MIQYIKKWGYFLVLLFVFNSCTYENVAFKGSENFKLKKLEGKTISLTFDAVLKNPNGYTIKVKPSDLDLYINGDHVGVIHLDEKIKIVKRSEGSVSVPVSAELMNGALPKLLAGALKKTASIRIVGKIKGSASLFPIKKKIDETREIPLRDLDFGGFPF